MSNESAAGPASAEPRDEPAATEPTATEPTATEQAATEPAATVTTATVSLRRAPKFSVFLVLGAVLGAVVTLIVTALFPVDPAIGFAALYGYFVLYGIPIGIVLGALVALTLDKISTRRAKEISAEQTTVDPLPSEATIEPEAGEPAESEPAMSSEPAAGEPAAGQRPPAAEDAAGERA